MARTSRIFDESHGWRDLADLVTAHVCRARASMVIVADPRHTLARGSTIVSGLQPRGLGERSRSPRPAVRRSGGSGDRRLLRGGARVRARRQRAQLDRDAARDHGAAARPPSSARFEPDAAPHRAARDGAPVDARRRSRRAALDPPADARTHGIDRRLLPRGLRRRHETSAPRSTASRRARWRSISARPTAGVPRRPGVCYFFPRPSAGSACKRLNLFLRWMMRTDEVDLGVWTRLPAARAGGAARHPRHPAGQVPAADALHEPGLEDGRRHHGLAARARSRAIRCASTFRCATSA